ncbi:MAG: cytochrome c oxidase subunit II [Brevundimonas sp.]|uniref:cytochrome c oxidase subunit II n=1 Tax=Brevundimonas sp. TaxID=1871086 RepID=UPI002733E1B5|nr:cytochrome c oxidase subunit II [Brevundimonas sp.]MDP3376821.1 cytochrome c oxidase subunit II [Brevundimonas sp.]
MALAGCEGALSTLDPAGPAARTIATLWWVMLAGAVAIFSLVMVLLALAFRKARPAPDEARHERLWVVNLGIAFPVVVLLALLAYGLFVGERLLPRAGPEVVSVGAEARRMAWTFTYEDAPGLATDHVLHIPAGRPVDVAVTTTDVIHSFWVPRLAGKIDAIPGHVNVLRIEADEPGVYAGRSAEFSGPGYDHFAFTVVAHDTDDWENFVTGQAR